MAAPFYYRWDGEAMQPLPRFVQACNREFVVGAVYRLEETHERSKTSHDHQFAWLQDAWQNLPERYKDEPWAQSSDALRKFALIKCRFCDTETFVCSSKAEAERWARNLRSMRAADEYALIYFEGTTVYRFTAHSQSHKAMGPKRFQESKQAIMDFIAALLEVSPEELKANAGRAA